MSNEQTEDVIAPIKAIAEEAGRAILTFYKEDLNIEHKDDRTPLTEADMAAHRIIVKGLRELTPEIPVLSEESSRIPVAERRQWERYWLVDPLDGTKEFIKRNDEFTVNIALIENNFPIIGVVTIPVHQRCYYAVHERGAFVIDGDGEPARIGVRDRIDGPVRIACSRSHPSARLQTYLDTLGEYELIPRGSSLKFCLIAEGSADIYVRLGKTCEWDTGAAQCVVEEAGGQVTDTEGKRLRYNSRDTLLNPEFLVFGDATRDWVKYLPG